MNIPYAGCHKMSSIERLHYNQPKGILTTYIDTISPYKPLRKLLAFTFIIIFTLTGPGAAEPPHPSRNLVKISGPEAESVGYVFGPSYKRKWENFDSWGKRMSKWDNLESWGKRSNWNKIDSWGKRSVTWPTPEPKEKWNAITSWGKRDLKNRGEDEDNVNYGYYYALNDMDPKDQNRLQNLANKQKGSFRFLKRTLNRMPEIEYSVDLNEWQKRPDDWREFHSWGRKK